MGDVTLESFLLTHKLVPDLNRGETKVLVTRFDDVPYEKYLELINDLRKLGVTASIYVGSKKFGKQIDYAVKGHYSHVVIMGASELEGGIVKIKDLESREESEVALSALSEYFN
jgi:histidyl-tRNA synthetase